MKPILQVFYSVFSGILLSLAIPNEIYLLGCPIYAFFAFIPYYLAIKHSKNYSSAFWLGFLNSLTTHLISSFWLAFFKDMAIFTLGASAIATAFLGGIFALLLFIPFSNHQRKKLIEIQTQKFFYENTSFKIFYFPAVYTLFEYIKSNGFLGYPWGTVSSAMYNFHLLTQIASITGTYGITFLVVLFNTIAAESFELNKSFVQKITAKHKLIQFKEIINSTIIFTILFASSLIYGSIEYYKIRKPIKYLTTIFVQQNSNSWEYYDDNKQILLLEQLSQEKIDELKKQKITPQLIVWSEGSLSISFPKSYSYYKNIPLKNPLISFITNNKIPLITGAPYREEFFKFDEYEPYNINNYNATILFSENGELKDYYAKSHLVPFAEYIPGIKNPIIKKVLKKISNIYSGWDPGYKYNNFEINCTNVNGNKDTVKIATPVCFDDAFSNVMSILHKNGAELFINLSDDSWSLTKSSEYQHFVIASYRAIEFRTSLLRSSNAGYSVITDPTGKILKDLPLFKTTADYFKIPVYKRQKTIYSILGDWLPNLVYVLLITTGFFIYKNEFSKNKKKLNSTKQKLSIQNHKKK